MQHASFIYFVTCCATTSVSEHTIREKLPFNLSFNFVKENHTTTGILGVILKCQASSLTTNFVFFPQRRLYEFSKMRKEKFKRFFFMTCLTVVLKIEVFSFYDNPLKHAVRFFSLSFYDINTRTKDDSNIKFPLETLKQGK